MPDGTQTSPRVFRKALTHDKIATTVRRMFTERSYEAVTIRNLAHAVGMSTGAVFNSWPDKAAMWREVMGCEPPVDDGLTRVRHSMLELLDEAATLYAERQHPGWLERVNQVRAAARGEAV
jgi:AcrR family transcriptional regulator